MKKFLMSKNKRWWLGFAFFALITLFVIALMVFVHPGCVLFLPICLYCVYGTISTPVHVNRLLKSAEAEAYEKEFGQAVFLFDRAVKVSTHYVFTNMGVILKLSDLGKLSFRRDRFYVAAIGLHLCCSKNSKRKQYRLASLPDFNPEVYKEDAVKLAFLADLAAGKITNDTSDR